MSGGEKKKKKKKISFEVFLNTISISWLYHEM